MATSSVNIANTMGAGSGIDTKALAQSLVEAERAPRKERIDAQIKKSEAKITGYSTLKYLLSELKTAFQGLNDAKDFQSLTVNNSQSSALTVTAGSTASAQALMSPRAARARPQITGPSGLPTLAAMRCTALKSPGLAKGKPASMMSTPRRASCCAIAAPIPREAPVTSAMCCL